MGIDPLSTIAPARLRAILLPVGPIKQSKFADFVDRLKQENVVRLGDVSPDGRPHRTMFSPLAFPSGSVIYDLSTSLPPPSHLALAPFELYREPLMVIGIADYASLKAQLGHELVPGKRAGVSDVDSADTQTFVGFLSQALAELQVEFPRALIHELLVFDHNGPSTVLPDGMTAVPPPESLKTTTMKTVMCDLTSHLLAEMTTYAKSLQALPMVESPKQGPTAAPYNSHISGLAAQMGFLAESFRLPVMDGSEGLTMSRTSIPKHMATESRSGFSMLENRSATSSDGTRTPPTTFDEIAMGSVNAHSSQSSTVNAKRPISQDKVSMHGFGAGSFGERERNKGKGRVGIIIGSLYLLAGRWPDAARELTENAMIARTHNDHIWHAKALDYLIVCLLMYAWAGIDFRIPQILFPGTEKQNSKSQSHIPVDTLSKPIGLANTSNLSSSLQQLTDVLPEVVKYILNLYVRAWTFTEDKLPQLSFSDSTIRFAKLLTNIKLSRGILDEAGLQRMVVNKTVSFTAPPPTKTRPFLTRAELAGLLFRAFPTMSSTDLVSVDDRIMILSGIASVLSDLGFHRKKAFILREILTVLLPALIQARKSGAAEMGLHPAARFLTNNAFARVGGTQDGHDMYHDHKNGIRSFLALVCHAYDILLCEISNMRSYSSKSNSTGSRAVPSDLDGPEKIIARLLRQASMRSCGNFHLKLEVLSLCTSICQALPDLEGVVRYSAEILRITGSGIAPGPDANGGSPHLAVEEQVRLANNISRTMSAGRQLGVQKLEAEYWDEFLVRSIEVVSPSPVAGPIPHAKADLGAAKTIAMEEEKTPFIYNPFRKSAASVPNERFIVAGEETSFQVTLQNLYDFSIGIDSIELDTMGLPFECEPIRAVVGPYRTQNIILSGTAKKPGGLTITGCRAKVSGCRERSYPVFRDPWKPKSGVKIGCREPVHLHEAMELGTERYVKITNGQGPSPSSAILNVIKAQPSLVLTSVSLPQSAVMLLEGETKVFNVILQNVSPIPVNFLFLSFDDSTTSQLRSALANKELSPLEVYELEHTSIHRQTFRWKRQPGSMGTKIDPGMKSSIEIEVLGKAGLSYGNIHVDYGYLEGPENESADRFYTRQLTIPLSITVNASIELVRNNVLPFYTDFTWDEKHGQQAQSTSSGSSPGTPHEVSRPLPSIDPHNHFQSLLGRIGLKSEDSDHCLISLDLRNSWPNLLSVSILIRSPGTSDPWKPAYVVQEPVQPGQTSRVLLLLPRIYLPQPTAPIPSLSSTTKRQYIVSSAPKASPESELASREVFHYREALLDHIRATWEEQSTKRAGTINLRALNLTSRMVSALKLDDLQITISVCASAVGPSSSSLSKYKQLSASRFQVPRCTFFTLTITLRNRSPLPIHPLLRIQPVLKDQPHNIALELGKKFLWSGLLQRGLKVLGPGQTTVSELEAIVLCSGIFEVGAMAEEIRVLDNRSGIQGNGVGETQSPEQFSSDHNMNADAHAAAEIGWKERRIWYAREKVIIVVEDDNFGNKILNENA